jgi:hypothetical protein
MKVGKIKRLGKILVGQMLGLDLALTKREASFTPLSDPHLTTFMVVKEKVTTYLPTAYLLWMLQLGKKYGIFKQYITTYGIVIFRLHLRL